MDINVPMYSCWYSLIKYKGEYIGVGRSQVTGDWTLKHPLTMVKLDPSNLAHVTETVKLPYWGEDPRLFYHAGDLYIVNNYIHNVQLINFDKGTCVQVKLPYKNFSWISHEGKLYAMFCMMPLMLFEVNPETGDCREVLCDSHTVPKYILYRGGTPGYRLGTNKNTYYGYGHMTYCQAIHGHPPVYEPFM
jgi:hypothetical protein